MVFRNILHEMTAWLIKSVSLTSVDSQLYLRSQSFSKKKTKKKKTKKKTPTIKWYMALMALFINH